jgi:hypothetical protein
MGTSSDNHEDAWTEDVQPSAASVATAIDALNNRWRIEHRKRARVIEKQLTSDHPGASAADKLLLALAGHDAAIAEVLGDAQLLLAKRVVTSVDHPSTTLALARALSETTSVRSAAAQRLEALLQAVTTMRAQRDLASSKPNPPHLRRVA